MANALLERDVDDVGQFGLGAWSVSGPGCQSFVGRCIQGENAGVLAQDLLVPGLAARAVVTPGKPQQNAYVERFNRTVRYESLSQHDWDDLARVQDFATEWMWQHNHERPNMGLGGVAPKQRPMAAA